MKAARGDDAGAFAGFAYAFYIGTVTRRPAMIINDAGRWLALSHMSDLAKRAGNPGVARPFAMLALSMQPNDPAAVARLAARAQRT